MELNRNRYKILRSLFPDELEDDQSLSGPELRKILGIKPLIFRKEISALIYLGWIESSEWGYRYIITAAGKAALNEARKKGIQDDEKQKELFK